MGAFFVCPQLIKIFYLYQALSPQLIGEKIPIPKTTFAAAAAGGISNVPMTNYDYRDVGIRIEITPFIHNNGDISMQLDRSFYQ